jgi:hypothetical protein
VQAKRCFLSLFELVNQRYIAELRNNPDVEADFTYSQFSQFEECIKTEKKNKKFPLKDILEVVQAALLKLYIELEPNSQKISRFFSEYGGDHSDSMIFVKVNEIEKFTRGAKF